MGAKSRGCWNLNFCMRKDCLNKGIKCNICIKYNEYITENIYSKE